jgi:hypothetical protein
MKSAKDWAIEVWDSEGALTLADGPPDLQSAAAAEYAQIKERNAECCRRLEAGYHTLQAAEIDAVANQRGGYCDVSLLPLDVGFDPLACDIAVTLPDDPRVLRVRIPAGRLHASWQLAYPYAIQTEGDTTTITSQHRSFVADTLRMAGYRVHA